MGRGSKGGWPGRLGRIRGGVVGSFRGLWRLLGTRVMKMASRKMEVEAQR